MADYYYQILVVACSMVPVNIYKHFLELRYPFLDKLTLFLSCVFQRLSQGVTDELQSLEIFFSIQYQV